MEQQPLPELLQRQQREEDRMAFLIQQNLKIREVYWAEYKVIKGEILQLRKDKIASPTNWKAIDACILTETVRLDKLDYELDLLRDQLRSIWESLSKQDQHHKAQNGSITVEKD